MRSDGETQGVGGWGSEPVAIDQDFGSGLGLARIWSVPRCGAKLFERFLEDGPVLRDRGVLGGHRYEQVLFCLYSATDGLFR